MVEVQSIVRDNVTLIGPHCFGFVVSAVQVDRGQDIEGISSRGVSNRARPDHNVGLMAKSISIFGRTPGIVLESVVFQPISNIICIRVTVEVIVAAIDLAVPGSHDIELVGTERTVAPPRNFAVDANGATINKAKDLRIRSDPGWIAVWRRLDELFNTYCPVHDKAIIKVAEPFFRFWVNQNVDSEICSQGNNANNDHHEPKPETAWESSQLPYAYRNIRRSEPTGHAMEIHSTAMEEIELCSGFAALATDETDEGKSAYAAMKSEHTEAKH